MFAVPALLAALAFALVIFAITASVFWAFIFGDDTWPGWAEKAMIGAPIVACIGIWAVLLRVAYDAGCKAEAEPELNRRHVVMAGGITVALLALAIGFKLAMETLNPPTPETACSDLCRGKGFGGSVMPPRNTGSNECSCMDSQGRTALKTELPPSGPRR